MLIEPQKRRQEQCKLTVARPTWSMGDDAVWLRSARVASLGAKPVTVVAQDASLFGEFRHTFDSIGIYK